MRTSVPMCWSLVWVTSSSQSSFISTCIPIIAFIPPLSLLHGPSLSHPPDLSPPLLLTWCVTKPSPPFVISLHIASAYSYSLLASPQSSNLTTTSQPQFAVNDTIRHPSPRNTSCLQLEPHTVRLRLTIGMCRQAHDLLLSVSN